jgi:hypothetical protein
MTDIDKSFSEACRATTYAKFRELSTKMIASQLKRLKDAPLSAGLTLRGDNLQVKDSKGNWVPLRRHDPEGYNTVIVGGEE